ncbi:MAG: polysaccharide biosynthesis protein [Idiomarina sp.]|nr:polysaccharide biosynthesis protein [Idiomarina sp.]
MMHHLFALPRKAKTAIALIADVLFLVFSLWFALSIRFETFYFTTDPRAYAALAMAVILSIVIFRQLGLYRAIVRYIGARALVSVWLGVILSAVVMYVAGVALQFRVPVSVIFSYGLTSLLLIGGSRLLFRAAVNRQSSSLKAPVIIYGAGASGRQLAQALFNGAEFKPVAFVDDDRTLHNSNMLGLTVYSPDKLKDVVETKGVKRVLLATPSATRAQRKAMLERVEPLAVQVQSIPGMADLVGGLKIDTLEEVKVEDLLGRDPVPPREHLMDRNIRDKVVMVTGAGGSIGSELCRQIIRYHPKTLVLFELSEYSLYAIEAELKSQLAKEKLESVQVIPMMGTVHAQNRVESVMKAFKVQTVYHAAAYKHVPMVEYNVVEGVRNNVFGTWHTAEAAVNAGVESFVLVSTDKAVRPTNVMGATKRMSELVLQAMAKRQEWTCFCMVRFGNVLGSSGSVVPKFREQINQGGPVTVTDKDITRYFMTIPEAAQLVIQAGAMSFEKHANEGSTGGDVFVLDMGDPVKIEQLARKLIRLMGKSVKDERNPTGDIEITYSGLRPGEKLYEELLIGDQVTDTDHPRIMTANEIDLPWNEVDALLAEMLMHIESFDIAKVHNLLKSAPLAFTPSDGISDLVWQASTHTVYFADDANLVSDN